MIKFANIGPASILAIAVLILPPTAQAGPAAKTPEVAAPSALVLLKSHAVVDDTVVRLSDLFEGLDGPGQSLGQTRIARAPEPGQRIEVKARWLAAVAQAYALPWRPASRFDKIMVERASKVIEGKRIEAAAMDALADRGISGNISVVFDNPAVQMHLPTDVSASLAVASFRYDPASGRFSGEFVAPAEGPQLARTTITGRAVAMTEIPVLVRRIEPGEVIAARDIKWIPIRVDRLSRNVVASQERLLGKSPRRPLRPGERILSDDLREPLLVEKNSIVTIRLVNSRMVLTVKGRALDQGAADDVVRVMNTKSKQIISATVVKSGLVQVNATIMAGINLESRK
jgi:flagellar basal body P-ring formation protein FlgA